MTVREPEWDEEQQALMLALRAVQTATCDGCGGHLPDTTTPEAEGAYRVGDAIRCHRCTAIGQAAEAYRESNQPQALRFPVERRR